MDEERTTGTAVSVERAALLKALLGFTQKLSDFDLLSLVAELAAGTVPRFRPSQVIGELSAIAQTYEAARRALAQGVDAAHVFEAAQSELRGGNATSGS